MQYHLVLCKVTGSLLESDFISELDLLLLCNSLGRLAQLVEQLTLNQQVAGSSPASLINKAVKFEKQISGGCLIPHFCFAVIFIGVEHLVYFVPQNFRDLRYQEKVQPLSNWLRHCHKHSGLYAKASNRSHPS